MHLGPFTLKTPFWRAARVPSQPVPTQQGAKICPPCSGNCLQGHACPARSLVAGKPAERISG